MDQKPRCSGTKADGEPCGAPPELVDPSTGFCPAHDPDTGSEEMAERGRKGGQHSPYEERLERLPEIEGPSDVQEILNRAIRATAQGNISEKRANSISRLCRTWVTVHETVLGTEKVEEIEEKIDDLREQKREPLKPWERA